MKILGMQEWHVEK